MDAVDPVVDLKPSEQLREHLRQSNNIHFIPSRAQLRDVMGWNDRMSRHHPVHALCLAACIRHDEEVCKKILIEVMKQRMLPPN